MQFDPMTGQPVTGQPVTGQPITGQPVTGKGKMSKKLLIAGAAVVAVGIGVVAGVSSGAFLSKPNKVLLATANTFKDTTDLTEAFDAMELLTTDSYTISVNGEIANNAIEATLASKKSKKQLSGKIDISGMPEIEGIIGVDSKELRAKTDYTGDTVFVYSYTKENDGYLLDNMDEEDIEMFNELLESLTSSKKQNDIQEDLSKAILKEFRDWKFEKVSKEEFEIDDKDRKCKGYQTTLTEDDMLDLVDASYSVLCETMDEDVLDLYYKNLTSAFKNMEDLDVTFYIYKNKLAAIVLEDDRYEYEIQFCGGEARWQNIVVKANHETILQLNGEVNGSTEEYELEIADSEVGSLAYNKKSGELQLEVGAGQAISLDANLKGNKNKLALTVESLEIAGSDIDCSGELVIKKGAKMQKISGEEFDLGNADEDEFRDMMQDLNDTTL